MLVESIFVWIIKLNLVSSLSCYQCNSSHHSIAWSIWLIWASILSNQHLTTGIYGAVMGITRFCSAWDLGNECQYLDFRIMTEFIEHVLQLVQQMHAIQGHRIVMHSLCLLHLCTYSCVFT
ncbi:unnamed protein product [Heterobilharzia americana]|nr:unnamed protein product [Heterobilharzia americana]